MRQNKRQLYLLPIISYTICSLLSPHLLPAALRRSPSPFASILLRGVAPAPMPTSSSVPTARRRPPSPMSASPFFPTPALPFTVDAATCDPAAAAHQGYVWLAASPRTRLVGANFTPIGCLHRDLGLSRRMQKSTLALAPGKRVSFPFPASQARFMRVGLQLIAVLARD
jgi:hypothetical protein